jgi:hypothetical protein
MRLRGCSDSCLLLGNVDLVAREHGVDVLAQTGCSASSRSSFVVSVVIQFFE